VIGGCSGGEDPVRGLTSTASATSSPSTTASTTTAASDIPAAARAHTPAGAEAFVRYFIDRVNYAWMTPEAGVIDALSQPACKSCADLERTARELLSDKQRYDRPAAAVDSVTALSPGDDGHQTVLFVGAQTESNIVNSMGNVVSTDPGQPSRRVFVLEWCSTHWCVSRIGDASA
jgi:hypothetical protein